MEGIFRASAGMPRAYGSVRIYCSFWAAENRPKSKKPTLDSVEYHFARVFYRSLMMVSHSP